jgi:hypothetical protein
MRFNLATQPSYTERYDFLEEIDGIPVRNRLDIVVETLGRRLKDDESMEGYSNHLVKPQQNTRANEIALNIEYALCWVFAEIVNSSEIPTAN